MHRITTTTHTITACYTIGDHPEEHAIETNGDNLAEIIADQLEFWNGHPERTADFEMVVSDPIHSGYDDVNAVIEGATAGHSINVYVTAEANE